MLLGPCCSRVPGGSRWLVTIQPRAVSEWSAYVTSDSSRHNVHDLSQTADTLLWQLGGVASDMQPPQPHVVLKHWHSSR